MWLNCFKVLTSALVIVFFVHHVEVFAFITPSILERKQAKHASTMKIFVASESSTTKTTTPTNFLDESVEEKLPYNWKDQWYALTFASYIPNPSESAETTPASVFDHPLVLWKAEDSGKIYCADDLCPHRSSALSEGRVRDGKIECLYHGWQFEGAPKSSTEAGGLCTFIPQLEKGAQIPKRACLKMRELRVSEGICWVWMGENGVTKEVPCQNDGLNIDTGEREGSIVNDFQIDLPYDHSYLVENLIDPAHIPISHDKTPGGGKRELAEAYEMIVDQDSISSTGFKGRYRTESQKNKNGPFIEVEFQAPGIIRQRGEPRPGIKFGAALHCMPLGLGRSRLLFRAYFSGLPKFAMFLLRLKPKFLSNLNSCKVLEQDVGLITTQEDHFARNPNRQLSDDFFMLKSSDLFVERYRKWMDLVGDGMPWYQGLSRRSANVANHLTGTERSPALDPANHRASNEYGVMETRYHRHVMKCPSTRKALAKVKLLKKIMCGSAISTITIAFALSSFSLNNLILLKRLYRWFIIPAVPLSSFLGVGLHSLEKRFYQSFKRKDELRTESGV